MHDLVSGIEFIFRGGFMMWPLLLSALIALTVIFERLYSFKNRFLTPPALVNEVLSKVRSGNLTEAEAICGKNETPVGSVLGCGVGHFKNPVEEMELAMKNQAEEWMPLLERRIEVIDTVKRPIKKARIEIIPMIDVIFFLLVFFMVESLAMTKINSMPVALPKTAANPEAIKQDFILTIKTDGSIFLNKTPATLDTIGSQLAYEMHDNPQSVVVVNADQGSNYGLVVQVMDKARQIGVRKFALATEANGKK
jgi:biopolymer transport protein ExbD